MRDPWPEILDCVLRPARPHLARCLIERDRHVSVRRRLADDRARAVAACEHRIHVARAAVFAANDGVVGSHMTDLEREWRTLARPDPEAGLMDLWARLVPTSSIDRKRWRAGPTAGWLDAAIGFAADLENVESAERAVDALREALAVYGTAVGTRVRWRPLGTDVGCAVALLANALDAARDACPPRHRAAILDRAHELEHRVRDAALARWPDRPRLALDLAHAASVDAVCHAASIDGSANPVTALRSLWKTGYLLAEVNASEVVLEFPALMLDVA